MSIIEKDLFETEEQRTVERDKLYSKVIGTKCPNIELGKHKKRPQEGV